MLGFSALLNRGSYTFRTEGEGSRVMQSGDYICYNNMNRKFEDDKVFYEDANYLIILDGVVLNRKTMQNGSSWPQILIDKYLSNETFFNDLRGSFSGVLFDKKALKYYVFSDHIGSKFLYYVQHEDSLFVSSMMSECYSFMKQNKIPYSLSVDNAYLLLTYGYMLEDRTLCDRIKKLEPGCYLTFAQGKVEQHTYCLLDNTPDNSISEQDALELLDEGFRKAVKLQFDKDDEYGYKHLVALSAGLDSRMVSWVAHEMGYTRQLNATFSQSDYWDQKVPMQIASDLGHEWIFKSLDGGWWLQDVDELTKVTGGNVQYYGLAHGRSLISLLNYDELGLTHSGQLGDVIFSSFYMQPNPDAPYKFGTKAYSTTYLQKTQERVQLHNQYKNEEIGNFYYRGFTGTNNGLLCNYEYNEVVSPFQDIDLLKKSLKIPLSIRYGHELYFKWILTRYPGAAKYVWEKMGCRIDRKFGLLNHHGKKIRIETIPARILNKLTGQGTVLNSRQNMNPIGYYVHTNIELRNWIDQYINDNIDRVKDKELHQDIESILKNDEVIDKIEALSLLSALKLYY